jgi:hypothetical protein
MACSFSGRSNMKADVPDPPGDGIERLDGSTLFWTESGSGNEFALCLLDEVAISAVTAALSTLLQARAAARAMVSKHLLLI